MTAYDAKRLGFHRQKDGGVAQVTTIARGNGVAGIDCDGEANIWDFDGECMNERAGPNYDLVEYLGEAIRAEAAAKKTIKLAPVLQKDQYGNYSLFDGLYATEGQAKAQTPDFFHWLIDTSYAIQIEVDE